MPSKKDLSMGYSTSRRSLHRRALPFPLLTFAAFCSSTKSLMIEYRSELRLARSNTSSVCTVVRPAWRLKLSRSIATFSAHKLDSMLADGVLIRRTDLRPHHLCERADELRSCVAIVSKRILVDHFAHRKPQSGFQTLCTTVLVTRLAALLQIVFFLYLTSVFFP